MGRGGFGPEADPVRCADGTRLDVRRRRRAVRRSSPAGRVAEQATAAGLHSVTLFALLDLARLGGPWWPPTAWSPSRPEGDGPYAIATRAHVAALVARDATALSASADRFEAMGAMLLAAEAAAQEAALHPAGGRKASAAAARGRATVLMARCGGARTPALLSLTAGPAMATLTDREPEVVRLAASGLTNRDIAERLFVSLRTVTTTCTARTPSSA